VASVPACRSRSDSSCENTSGFTQPGIEASASTAARMLLFRALEQVEEEMGVRKRQKK
jgi:hypothetical protein